MAIFYATNTLFALSINIVTSQDEQHIIWSDDMNNGDNWQTSIYFGGQENGNVHWISNNEKCTNNGNCAALSEAGIQRLTTVSLYQNMGITFDYVFECNDFSSGSSCYIDSGYACLDNDPSTLTSYSLYSWPRIKGTENNNLQHEITNFSLNSECNNKPYILIKFDVHFTTQQIAYLDNIILFNNMDGYSNDFNTPQYTSTTIPNYMSTEMPEYTTENTHKNTKKHLTSTEISEIMQSQPIKEVNDAKDGILYMIIVCLCVVIIGLIIGFTIFYKRQIAKYSNEIQNAKCDDPQYEGMLTNANVIDSDEGADRSVSFVVVN